MPFVGVADSPPQQAVTLFHGLSTVVSIHDPAVLAAWKSVSRLQVPPARRPTWTHCLPPARVVSTTGTHM